MYKQEDYKLTDEEYRTIWEEWDIHDLMDIVINIINKKTKQAYNQWFNDSEIKN
jgi:ribosomal silencing factor RsfS